MQASPLRTGVKHITTMHISDYFPICLKKIKLVLSSRNYLAQARKTSQPRRHQKESIANVTSQNHLTMLKRKIMFILLYAIHIFMLLKFKIPSHSQMRFLKCACSTRSVAHNILRTFSGHTSYD